MRCPSGVDDGDWTETLVQGAGYQSQAAGSLFFLPLTPPSGRLGPLMAGMETARCSRHAGTTQRPCEDQGFGGEGISTGASMRYVRHGRLVFLSHLVGRTATVRWARVYTCLYG